jgi:hypothetical protein
MKNSKAGCFGLADSKLLGSKSLSSVGAELGCEFSFYQPFSKIKVQSEGLSFGPSTIAMTLLMKTEHYRLNLAGSFRRFDTNCFQSC